MRPPRENAQEELGAVAAPSWYQPCWGGDEKLQEHLWDSWVGSGWHLRDVFGVLRKVRLCPFI